MPVRSPPGVETGSLTDVWRVCTVFIDGCTAAISAHGGCQDPYYCLWYSIQRHKPPFGKYGISETDFFLSLLFPAIPLFIHTFIYSYIHTLIHKFHMCIYIVASPQAFTLSIQVFFYHSIQKRHFNQSVRFLGSHLQTQNDFFFLKA